MAATAYLDALSKSGARARLARLLGGPNVDDSVSLRGIESDLHGRSDHRGPVRMIIESVFGQR